MNNTKEITMIYIMGAPHSGSTLLNILLGEGENCFSLGEFNYMFKSIIRDSLCSCKNVIKNCSFWNEILIEIFGEKLYFSKELYKILEIQKKIERLPILNFIKKSYYFKKIKKEIEFYREIIYKILKLIVNKTHKRILIDSTKRPHYFYIFKELPIEFIIIHLIRDPRGVVWSYYNPKYIPYTGKFRKTHHPLTTIKSWLKVNLQIEYIKLLYKNLYKFYEIKIEEFISNPELELLKLSKNLNLSFNFDRLFQDKNVVLLNKQNYHLIGGSEIKYSINNENKIILRNIEEWKIKLPSKYKLLTKALTFPFLINYKYF